MAAVISTKSMAVNSNCVSEYFTTSDSARSEALLSALTGICGQSRIPQVGVTPKIRVLQWRIQDFPEEGAPTPGCGAPKYDFAKFCQKLHEIERIWTLVGGGACPSRPP